MDEDPLTAGIWRARDDNLETASGSYLLCFVLDRDVTVAIRKHPWHFVAGSYVYCGSARGPGGLKARLARHFRDTKKTHWHIDHLTIAAFAIGAFVFTDVTECTLCRALLARPEFAVPVPGFGSSDCRSCSSHLLRFDPRDE